MKLPAVVHQVLRWLRLARSDRSTPDDGPGAATGILETTRHQHAVLVRDLRQVSDQVKQCCEHLRNGKDRA